MSTETFRARLFTGDEVTLIREDRGDSVPGFDASGKRFRSYTTRWHGQGVPETWLQLDAEIAEASGDVLALRTTADRAFLCSLGVNLNTLRAA